MDVINKNCKFHKYTRTVVGFILFMANCPCSNNSPIAEMIATFKVHTTNHINKHRGIARQLQGEWVWY